MRQLTVLMVGGEETFLLNVRAHTPFALWAGSRNTQIFFQFFLAALTRMVGGEKTIFEGEQNQQHSRILSQNFGRGEFQNVDFWKRNLLHFGI